MEIHFTIHDPIKIERGWVSGFENFALKKEAFTFSIQDTELLFAEYFLLRIKYNTFQKVYDIAFPRFSPDFYLPIDDMDI